MTNLGSEHGNFACSDSRINAIWQIGSDALKNSAIDCLEIPALLYTACDRKASRAALLTIFGTNSDELRYDLPLAAEQIESAWRHFLFTGDRTILGEIQPKIDSILKSVTTKLDDEGLISNTFAGNNQLSNSALFSHALRFASRIARATGNPERAGEMEMLLTDVSDSINELLWQQSSEGYRSKPTGEMGQVDGIGSLIAAVAEVPDRYQLESVRKTIGCLAPWSTETIPSDILNFTLKAMAKLGFYGEALQIMSNAWQPNSAGVALSSFEPNSFLASEIAGIKPIQPGFEEFAIKVQPAGLSSVEASVHTIRGPIAISWRQSTEDAVSVELSSPKGIRGHLTIPTDKPVRTVTINDQVVYDFENTKRKSTMEGFDVAHRKLRFRTPGGTYKFEVASL